MQSMEQSDLKQGENFVQREWTCEPKERVRSKKPLFRFACPLLLHKIFPLRNLGAELNVREVPVRVDAMLDRVPC